MVLRYSATHKTTHNKIHRLDALDAYNQKLVKKIAVRGIAVKGLAGTAGYLRFTSGRKMTVAQDRQAYSVNSTYRLKPWRRSGCSRSALPRDK
jgi:restriction endonuclease